MNKHFLTRFLNVLAAAFCFALSAGTAMAAAEIDVEQSGTPIANNGTLAFGEINLSSGTQTISRTFTIKNTGDADLTGLLITRTGSAEFSVTQAPVAPVSAGSSTTFSVQFAPTSVGSKTATFSIASNDANENPYKITVTGTAVAPLISIEESNAVIAKNGTKAFGTVDLGSTTLSIVRTFTIKNTGTAALTSLLVGKSGTSAADFTVSTPLATSVAANASTTFTVTFAPSAVGGKTAALSITSNDANNSPYVINLTATATAPTIAVEQPVNTPLLNSAIAAFGDTSVGFAKDLTFTVRNNGTSTLNLTSFTIGGADSRLFNVEGTAPSAIGAGQSGAFTIRFAPGQAGSYVANLTIANNTASGAFIINLEGQGSAVSPLEDAFGYKCSDIAGGNILPFLEPGGDGVLTETNLSGIDKAVPLDIGFDFYFYEKAYSRCFISTTGLVTFTGSSVKYQPDNIPNTSSPDNYIAPLWTDLQIIDTGRVLYKTVGVAPDRIFVVKYHQARLYNNGAGTGKRVSFQVQLYETSNSIQVRYKDEDPTLAFPAQQLTIGIESRNYGSEINQPGAGVVGSNGIVGIQYRNGLFTNAASRPTFPSSILFTRPVVISIESQYARPTPTESNPNATTPTNVGTPSLGLNPGIGTIYKTAYGTNKRFEAPAAIYLNKSFQQLSSVGEVGDPDPEKVAWYRLVNDGYAIDGQVVQGTQTFFTTTLTRDVTVIWRWRLECAVIVESATGNGGYGNPEPAVGRTWYGMGQQFVAGVGGGLEDIGSSSGLRFRSTGYTLYDKNAVVLLNAPSLVSSEVRQTTTPVSITQPLRLKWNWTGQVRYRFDAAGGQPGGTTTLFDGLSFVRVNGGTPVYGSGANKDVWIDMGSQVQVGSFYRSSDRCYTLGNFLGAPDGDLFSLGSDVSQLPDVTFAGRVARVFSVTVAMAPTTVHWIYQPTVFRAVVPLGTGVGLGHVFVPELCDGGVLSDAGPNEGTLVPVGQRPTGPITGNPWRWDQVGKEVFPVHPGSNQFKWADQNDPTKSYIIELVSGYPGDTVTLVTPEEESDGRRKVTTVGPPIGYTFTVHLPGLAGDFPAFPGAHYRHLLEAAMRQPPTKLDLSGADPWKFQELTYADFGIDAVADKTGAGVPFNATAAGRSVILYSYRPNRDEVADGNLGKEKLAVRVVRSETKSVIGPDHPLNVLGRRGLDLGGGAPAADGAVGVIASTGTGGSINPGKNFVIDFWLNAKDLQAGTPVALANCTTSAGSTAVSCQSTNGLVKGMNISGTTIPVGAKIAAINGPTGLTLTAPAVAAGSSLSLTASNKPVTVLSSGEGKISVTLDEAEGTISAGYLGLKASHEFSKAGASWRHYVVHVFEDQVFGSGVTVLDFYVDGVRQEKGGPTSGLSGVAPATISFGTSLTNDTLRFGAGADPQSRLQLDQFRLFRLPDANRRWLATGEIQKLRSTRDMTTLAANRLRTAQPLLWFDFERPSTEPALNPPTSAWSFNRGTVADVGVGPLSPSTTGEFAGTWARVGLQEVATRLESTLDNAGFGGSGYVLNAVSNYNAEIYDRSAEIGTWGSVFPVNDRQLFTAANRRLQIAYYENPYRTEPQMHPNVAWPYQAAAYDEVVYPAYGPHKDKAIYIASRVGSEGVDRNGRPQTIFDLGRYSNLTIYNQPDTAKAGYNPNEEHALAAPSGRAALKVKNLGADVPNNPPLAAFALQKDINASASAYTSAPWTLVQVNNLVTGEPEMAAYQVFKTRAGGSIPFPRPSDSLVNTTSGLAYESASNPEDRFLTLDPAKSYDFNYGFTYPVAAGDLVVPPYPLNLVVGNVPMPASRGGNDGSQRTLWKDVSGNAWVVSGGGRFFYQYFYPFRGDFHLPNTAPGTPVAWVPDQVNNAFTFTGATASIEPGKVVYNSIWRTSYPKLKRGETLTYQGGEYFNENPGSNGLPALVAMKAAEIVFDSSTPAMVIGDANLHQSSARIIRPLDRHEAPFKISQMADAGFTPAAQDKLSIIAERWYFKDLPGSLQRRFYFDSLAEKLVFRGYLNEKDSGDSKLTSGPDPLNILEPNVMTTEDLAQVKALGLGSVWTNTVTSIHGKSQNPMLIRNEAVPGAPTLTGQYLAGLKESPLMTTRIGLNAALYSATANLTIELTRLAQQTARLLEFERAWNIHLMPYSLFQGGLTSTLQNQTASASAVAAASTQVAAAAWAISQVVPQGDASKYVHLDSFGVGSALVPSPKLLTNPVTGSLYVTIAENNRDELDGAPVTLHIVEIVPDRYRGAIKVIEATDAFSEKVTLQHNGEFGANTGDLYYEWWIRDAGPLDVVATEMLANGNLKETDASGNSLWQQYIPEPKVAKTPAELTALGVTAEQAKHLGLHSIVFEGRPDVTLADKLVLMRYRHKSEANWTLVPFEVADSKVAWKPGNVAPVSPAPFQWAGAANSPQLQADGSKRYVPQLVMGWVKRVLDRINPYEARYNDFFSNESPAAYSSQIQIAGGPFAGKVALNSDKNVIENTGLIELYETVLARARELSIDNSSNGNASDGIKQALLLAATRLSVLYELLAREAYSDAQDSTIAVTDDSGLASVASFTHAFQNMEADLQHEELALLRGTDFLKSYPVNNRMFWNYAKGLGEAAYNINYNIYDVNKDGFINEADARALYPQGHGDAWGHFVSALGMHYTLLQHPGFSWKTRSELYSLMQNVLEVDFLDEKSFAKMAAGKARAGRDIVRGTYRKAYTQDPAGQWQGYTDAADPARAWGVSEWAERAGQAAYFDWIVANSLLPQDAGAATPVVNPENLDRIDRLGNIDEIGEIAGGLHEIQVAVDEANGGVNPLGFDSDAIAFDIDPFLDGDSWELSTHFEQIYERAIVAGENAKATLDFATAAGNKLRLIADDTDEIIIEAFRQDLDYRNRLIEIFGRPYDGTIGFGKAYAEGYEGPDTLLFAYLDRTKIDTIMPESTELIKTPTTFDLVDIKSVTGLSDNLLTSKLQGLYTSGLGNAAGKARLAEALKVYITGESYLNVLDPSQRTLKLPVRRTANYAFQAEASWGQRTSYGQLQQILESMLLEEIALEKANDEYLAFLGDFHTLLLRLKNEIELAATRSSKGDTIATIRKTVNGLIVTVETAIGIYEAVDNFVQPTAKGIAEALPRSIGFSNDVTSIGRGIAYAAGAASSGVFNAVKSAKDIVKRIAEFSRDEAIFDLERDLARLDQINDLEGLMSEIELFSGDESPKRRQIAMHLQELEIKRQAYFTAQAAGFRLLKEREAFNKVLASKVQKNRYQDMIFRLSRNEAMGKYQSAFNNAARYAWLAARAYDYETSLDPGDPAAPGALLDKIVKERQLGLWSDGEPKAGQGGLAEILNHLNGNFKVLRGQLGINNPQSELEKISLRGELFRINPADADIAASDGRWKDALKARIVPDLTKMPEFTRYCRPFSTPEEGAQPGIVIRFSSHINNGVNFFGKSLAPGDHNYSTANYATKVRGFGVWLENYKAAGLATSPRAYLVPIGNDHLRTSSSAISKVRSWSVLEQRIPTPFVINPTDLTAPGYIPTLNGVDGGFAQLRRHGDFRMYHDNGNPEADDSELTLTSRLIGRSVWNSEWMLIIPGAGLHVDPLTGLTSLANTVSDIKLHFKTYSHQGQ